MSQAEVRSKLLRVLVKAVAPAAGVVSLLAQLTVKAIPPRTTVEWLWLMAAVVFTVAPPFIPAPERAAAPPDPPPPPLPKVAIGFVPRDEPWARWLAGILELAGEAPSLRPWSSSAGLGAVPGDDRTVFLQSRSVDFLEPAAQDRIRAWLEQADALILRIDQNARTILHGAGRPPVNMDFATEDVAWEAVSARLDLGLPAASVSRIRRELEQPAGGTPTRGGYPRTGPRIHNLQRRTSEFVGRTAELELIERTLLDPTATGFGLCVLSGLPGVGKTSIAAEYAIRALEHYRIVWWITADISSTVAGGLLDLCAELGLPDIGDGPANVKALWAALMRRSDWLLILDNLEPAAEIAGHLPEEGLRAGRVLVTSRRPDLPVPLSGGV
ncbi:MAG: ATP-binding protein, partial [Catenulispora sp.]|nr:ATP-binding protein [Catenulispora sp.]